MLDAWRSVVRKCRLRSRGAGARSLRADAATALLQYIFQDCDRAGYSSGRAACIPSGPRPHHIFSIIPLRSQRHRISARAPLLGVARRTAAAHLHQPLECVSRIHRRGRKSRRHEGHARAGQTPIAGIEHVMQPYGFGEGFGEDPCTSPRARPTRSRLASSRSGRRTWQLSSASPCRAPGASLSSRGVLATRCGDLQKIRRAADYR